MNQGEQASLDRIIRFEKGLTCPLCDKPESECQCMIQEIADDTV